MGLFKKQYNDDTFDGQGAERDGSLLEVISHSWDEKEIAWKYPHNEIHKGNHLIVEDMQAVLFYSSGLLADIFNPNGGFGQDVTLDVNNIPLLSKLVNKPWGRTPWPAEVFFINLVPFRELYWGTSNPVNILDKSLGDYPIPIPVRSAVQYGVKVTDPVLFMRQIVGTSHVIVTDDIESRFAATIASKFSVVTTTLMRDKAISALDVNAYLEELSAAMKDALQTDVSRYGLIVESFSFLNFSPDLEDSNVKAIYEARAKRSALGALGMSYQTERQLDIMQSAAANEGGAGQIMGAGMGIGMGVGLGNAFGAQMGNAVGAMQPQMQAPPPVLSAPQFYVYIGNNQSGPYSIQQLQQFAMNMQMTKETLVWTAGMPQWVAAGQCPQLQSIWPMPPSGMPPVPPVM